MNNKILLSLIPCLLFVTACDFDGAYDSYADADKYTILENAVELETEQLTFETLDIAWHKGNITIASTDTGTISISEEKESTPKDIYQTRYLINEKTLYIKFAGSGVNLSRDVTKDLTIYINTTIESLSRLNYSLTTTLGDINISTINAKSMRVSTYQGNVNLEKVSSPSPEVGVQRGNVTANDLLFTGMAEIAANYGTIDLTLNENITGFIPDFRIIDGTSIVYDVRFPEGNNFYGSHMAEDVTLMIVLNHGDLIIF